MGRVTVVSATVAALSFVASGSQPTVVSHIGSQQLSLPNARVLAPAPALPSPLAASTARERMIMFGI